MPFYRTLNGIGSAVGLGEIAIDMAFDFQALKGNTRIAYDYYRIILTTPHVNVITVLSISQVIIMPLMEYLRNPEVWWLVLWIGNLSATFVYCTLVLPRYGRVTGGQPNAWQSGNAPYNPSVFKDWWIVLAFRIYAFIWIFLGLISSFS